MSPSLRADTEWMRSPTCPFRWATAALGLLGILLVACSGTPVSSDNPWMYDPARSVDGLVDEYTVEEYEAEQN